MKKIWREIWEILLTLPDHQPLKVNINLQSLGTPRPSSRSKKGLGSSLSDFPLLAWAFVISLYIGNTSIMHHHNLCSLPASKTFPSRFCFSIDFGCFNPSHTVGFTSFISDCIYLDLFTFSDFSDFERFIDLSEISISANYRIQRFLSNLSNKLILAMYPFLWIIDFSNFWEISSIYRFSELLILAKFPFQGIIEFKQFSAISPIR